MFLGQHGLRKMFHSFPFPPLSSLLFPLALSLAAACSGGDSGSTCTDGCDQRDPDGPEIITLSVNSTRLTEDETLVVTAIVTDPDGIADVIGGELRDPVNGTYGAFATGAQEGAYSLTLSWSALHQVSSIEGPGDIARELQAHFFDSAGNETIKSLSLTFTCGVSGESFCDAKCVDMQTDAEHCGACRTALEETECSEGALVCDDPISRVCDDSCEPNTVTSCGSCGHDCTLPPGELPSGASYSTLCRQNSLDGSEEALPAEHAYCLYVSSTEERTSCDAQCGALACVQSEATYEAQFSVAHVEFGCAEVPPVAVDDHTFSILYCSCLEP